MGNAAHDANNVPSLIGVNDVTGLPQAVLVDSNGRLLLSVTSAIGPTGYTGTTGFTGYTGAGNFTGYTGYSGYTGTTGYTGPGNFTGYTGYTGPQITGYTGYSGYTGYTGPQGAGPTGYTGYTGYTGAGNFTGYTGYSGYTGTTGYTGPGNFTGYTGYTGPTGFTGYTGYTAYTGYTGPAGAAGTTGYTGYTGPGGASTPSMKMATIFEDIARFTKVNTGGGDTSIGVNGLNIVTSATGTSSTSIKLSWQRDRGLVFSGSPTWTCMFSPGTFGTDFSSYFGLGQVTVTGTAHTYTTNHIGFKLLRAASGTASLYATQGDGSTENASSALTTSIAGDVFDLIIKVNSSTSVDYYWRKNGGALSSATNLTSNMPSLATELDYMWQLSVSNNTVASSSDWYVSSVSYER